MKLMIKISYVCTVYDTSFLSIVCMCISSHTLFVYVNELNSCQLKARYWQHIAGMVINILLE